MMSRFPISSGRAKPPASIRIDGGGYRRDHLRALAQRVEVADCEVRIIGSKSSLLQTLTAAAGVKAATPGVRSSVLKWRMGRPPN
jgi:site-specific DNA recombinase